MKFSRLTQFSLGLILAFLAQNVFAQDDLMSILEESDNGGETEYVTASFKSTRLINGHSIEMRPAGVLEFVIGHRFGRINDGIDEFFGLDDSQIRIGLEYGLSKRLNVGIGRSSQRKTLDGFLKYKILRQATTGGSPISLVAFSSVAINTGPGAFTNINRDNKNSHRFSYTYQILAARKFNSNFTFQIMPTLVHRNIVVTAEEHNDIMALGFGGRHKITKRLAINAEYYYQLNQNDSNIKNAVAIGFDIETGGHVFQLHFTNARSMIERGFITETDGDFWDGDIHFGFNISRVFNLKTPK